MEKLNIVFREFEGQVTAVFLNEINHHSRLELVCYAHLGQHGGCSIDWLYRDTKPATKERYQSLLSELTNVIGYKNLTVKKRLPSYDKTVQVIAQAQRDLDRAV